MKHIRISRLAAAGLGIIAALSLCVSAFADNGIPVGEGWQSPMSDEENARLAEAMDLDNKEQGEPYDSAGLLTYRSENGEVTIMSCSEATQGDVYVPTYINGEPVTAINDYAFLFCASVTSITLPETVRDIGQYAFFCCTQLGSVTFGGDIDTIGSNAFYRCYDLTSVSFKGNVGMIGYYAFGYCTGLTKVEFQGTVNSVGSYAFEHCTALTYIDLPGVTVIGNYAFSGSALTSLPIQSYGDTLSIGSYAFSYCEGLTDVKLSAIVRSLGDGAFAECPNLRSADISGISAKQMGKQLFYNCTALTSVSLPSSWTAIADEAFYNCYSLQYTLASNLTSIGASAFYGCTSLAKNLVIPSGVTSIGQGAFQNCSPTSVTLPSGLTEVPAYAFDYCPNLISVTLPEGITSIGAYAFGGNSLTSLKLPSTLETLGDYAFGASSATEDDNGAEVAGIPTTGTVSEITLPSRLQSIGIGALDCCTQIEMDELVLPDSLTYIGSLFGGYKKLVLPEGLETVAKRAFAGNTALEEVVILCPSSAFSEDGSIYSIGSVGYFAGCTNLTNVSIPDDWTEIPAALLYNTGIREFDIPEGVTTILTGAFGQCSNLVSVSLPSTLTMIYPAAFENCASLKSVQFPSGLRFIGQQAFYKTAALTTVTFVDGVQLDASAFASSGLTSLTLPDGVTFSGSGVFQNCASLESVTINGNIINSDDYVISNVFSGCSNLKTVTIGKGVTEIPFMTFYGCEGLTTVHLSDTVKVIGYSAFQNCVSLTDINFPDGLEEIRQNAFTNTALTDIHLPSSLIRLDTLSFSDISALRSVYLEDGMANDVFRILIIDIMKENLEHISGMEGCWYDIQGTGASESELSAFYGCFNLSSVRFPSNWTYIPAKFLAGFEGPLGNVTLGNGITAIGSNAFDGATGITSVTLPDSLVSIGDYAFNGCTGLTSLTLPERLKSLGAYALYGCTGLTSLKLPDGLPEDGVGEYAIAGCANLKEVTLPADWTSVPDGLFQGNKSIENYNISEGVTRIGEFAFTDSSIKQITLPSTLKTIEANAFQNCVQLTSVDLPEGLETLGEYAFSGSGLTEITIPGTVDTISALAFYDCGSLTTVVIKDGVSTINGMAFSFCESLKTATIPDSVVNMTRNVFYGCGTSGVKIICSADSTAEIAASTLLYLYSDNSPALFGAKFSFYPQDILFSEAALTENVYVEATTTYVYYPFIQSDICYYVDYDGMYMSVTYEPLVDYKLMGISVKKAASVNYIKANDFANYYAELISWDTSFTSLTVPDDVGGIPITGFGLLPNYDYSSLRSLTIGKNMETIGGNLYYCSNLESVTFPEGAVTIKSGTFMGLTGLTSIALPSTLKTIDENAFLNCTNLASVTFKEGLTTINEAAFQNTALTEVYLPSTLETLHATAFDSGVVFHFTGNAGSLMYVYYTIGDDGIEVKHTVYALPDILYSLGVRVEQFTGEGLDNQDTYFISTESAGLASDTAEATAPVGDVNTSAETAPVLDTLDTDNEIVYEEAKEEITEEPEPEPEESHVYELVLKAVETVKNNPLVTAAVVCFVIFCAGIGGVHRWLAIKKEERDG